MSRACRISEVAFSRPNFQICSCAHFRSWMWPHPWRSSSEQASSLYTSSRTPSWGNPCIASFALNTFSCTHPSSRLPWALGFLPLLNHWMRYGPNALKPFHFPLSVSPYRFPRLSSSTNLAALAYEGWTVFANSMLTPFPSLPASPRNSWMSGSRCQALWSGCPPGHSISWMLRFPWRCQAPYRQPGWETPNQLGRPALRPYVMSWLHSCGGPVSSLTCLSYSTSKRMISRFLRHRGRELPRKWGSKELQNAWPPNSSH